MSWPDASLSPRVEFDAPGLTRARLRRPRRLAVRVAPWVKRVGAPVLAGAAMLFAVTLLIGRPTVFTDTDDYFGQGRDVARAFTLWATKGVPVIKLAEVDDRLHDPGDQDEEPVHNQNGARSVYYGLFVWACEALGSLWVLAAAQAALAAGIVYTLWRTVAPGARARSYLAMMAALAAGSGLPVFTGFAMPDLFAGFSVVATLLVTLYGDRFGRWGKLALFALLAACVNFHGSNMLTAIGLGVLALGWLGLRRQASWRALAGRAGMVAGAVVLSVLAAKAYAFGIKLRTGDDLGRPPFLTARVLADGPGRAYLRHACAAGEKLTLCPYAHAPLDDTEDILWSDDPAKGIFNSADYHLRARIEREERAFALQGVLFDPWREARAALGNWGAQLVAVGYQEPLRDPAYYLTDDYWKTTSLKGLLTREKPCDPEAGGCILHVPAKTLAELDAAVALAALGWIGWLFGRGAIGGFRKLPTPSNIKQTAHPGEWRDPDRMSGRRRFMIWVPAFAGMSGKRGGAHYGIDVRARAAVLLMVAGVVLNAAVCGMLSGPFDRYEARLLWLLPAAAMLLTIASRRQDR